MTVIINAYKNGSRGAKRLKAALLERGVRKVFVMQKAPKNPKAMIVTWGNTNWKYGPANPKLVVNNPDAIKVLTNKREFFRHVGHSPTVPEWTEDKSEVKQWGCKFMARQKLEGSGGEGIGVYDDDMRAAGITIPEAPLYVKYENKTHEFRVHMARGWEGDHMPILIQRKIFQKTEDKPQPGSWDVRNHANGFVYVRNSGYPTPKEVPEVAEQFMKEHFPDAHFCALDIIFHEKRKTAFVLEGNTAPGLEGNTVEVYADYLYSMAKLARAI